MKERNPRPMTGPRQQQQQKNDIIYNLKIEPAPIGDLKRKPFDGRCIKN